MLRFTSLAFRPNSNKTSISAPLISEWNIVVTSSMHWWRDSIKDIMEVAAQKKNTANTEWCEVEAPLWN